MNIVLIGAGNVAIHLGPALKKNGHKIIQVYSRSKKSGNILASKLKCHLATSISKITTQGDIYIIALRDEAISSFLSEINFIPKLIVHTSGSVEMNIFPSQMENIGVLYPIQTFSKIIKKDPVKFPFCIEASNKLSLTKIKKLALSFKTKIYQLNSVERSQVHLAAVFANNFTNYMFIIAEKILRKNKIPFEILKPLILETAQKILSNTPDKIQTGPAARGDASIIKKHLLLLNDNPDLKQIYSLLTNSIEKEFGPVHRSFNVGGPVNRSFNRGGRRL